MCFFCQRPAIINRLTAEFPSATANRREFLAAAALATAAASGTARNLVHEPEGN